MIDISEIHANPSNPRKINDLKFQKLIASIKEFPKMLKLRPIIVDNGGVILGGNMRFKALIDLGYKSIPEDWIKRADELTDEEKRRFIIEDNVPFGEWDYELLDINWDKTDIEAWGLDLPVYMNDEIKDITNVETFTENVNFNVKCKNLDELALLQEQLDVTSNSMSYDEFIKRLK